MDYTYPSIFFSYFIFFLFLAGAIFFCIRSLKRGYWNKDAEEVKYQVFNDQFLNDQSEEREATHGRWN